MRGIRIYKVILTLAAMGWWLRNAERHASGLEGESGINAKS
jgi:hypothetical protein